MNALKTSMLAIAFMGIFISLNAQTSTLLYEYDAAGNRIVRKPEVARTMARTAFIPDIIVSEIPLDQANAESQAQINIQQGLDPFRSIIYPNPTQGLFSIELPDWQKGEKGDIKLYDLKGQMVLYIPTVLGMQEVNITHFSSGHYYVHMRVGEYTVIRKVLKD